MDVKSLAIGCALSFCLGMAAQAPINKGASQVNVGFGLSSFGFPVYGNYEYAVIDNLTIGGQASFTSKVSTLGLMAFSDYHFNRLLDIPSEWNFYAGVALGYYSNQNNGIGLGLHIGGRYYFSKKVGFNLEFGGGTVVSGGKLGLSIRL